MASSKNMSGYGVAFHADDEGMSEVIENVTARTESMSKGFDAVSDKAALVSAEWDKFNVISGNTERILKDVENLTKTYDEWERRSDVMGKSMEEAFGRKATLNLLMQLDSRKKELLEQYDIIYKQLPAATEEASKAYEDLASRVEEGSKKISRDIKGVEKDKVNLGRVFSDTSRLIGTGMESIVQGYRAIRGAQMRGLLMSLDYAQQMTDQIDLITSAFEGTYTEARIATKELQASFGSTLKNTSKFRSEITRLSIGLNMDIGTTSKAYTAAFRMNMDTNNMFIGSMKDVLKSTKMLGTDAEEMITSMAMMRSHWGMNEEAIKSNVDAFTQIGREFGIANEVMSKMPSMITDIDKRYREMGIRAPEASLRTARSVAALAGAFSKLASPGEAMDMALDISKNLTDEQAQLRKMQYGLADDIGPIAQIFTEGLGDMGLAFELLEKEPHELAIALQKMAKDAEAQGGATEWSFNRMRIQLQEVAPAMAAAMDSQHDLNKELKKADRAVSGPEKALSGFGNTFANVGEQFYDTGRSMSEAARHNFDVIKENIIETSGISRKEIFENMGKDFEYLTEKITNVNRATNGWLFTLLGAKAPLGGMIGGLKDIAFSMFALDSFFKRTKGPKAFFNILKGSSKKLTGFLGIAALVGIAYSGIKNSVTVWRDDTIASQDKVLESASRTFTDILGIFTGLFGVSKEETRTFVDWLGMELGLAIDFIVGHFDYSWNRLKLMFSHVSTLAKGLFQGIVAAAEKINFRDLLFGSKKSLAKGVSAFTEEIAKAFVEIGEGEEDLEKNRKKRIAHREAERRRVEEEMWKKGKVGVSDSPTSIGAPRVRGVEGGAPDDRGDSSVGAGGAGGAGKAARSSEPRAASDRVGSDDLLGAIHAPNWYYNDFRPLLLESIKGKHNGNRSNMARGGGQTQGNRGRAPSRSADHFVDVDLVGNAS